MVLAESHTSERGSETSTAISKEPSRTRMRSQAAGVAQFLAVVMQFGLIVLVVNYWQLEGLRVGRLMQLALIGFVIHHLLPLRFRLPFFAMLSLASVITIVGQISPRVLLAALSGRTSPHDFLESLIPGLTLVGIGLGLLGLCHLPIRLGLRIALLAAAGAGLAFVRVNSQWFPNLTEIWLILGSMFMFRLIIYLYDLRHRTAPFSPARAISYFFLLPNICFPLFPVVDYKTFCSTYYNEDWLRIYQTGLKWMFRGVIQLLLYRLVYQYAPLEVSKLSSALGAAGFMLGAYLLYLRVSGTFHLIVGLLLMFGFNLPETHHLYYLATSFTDFWRRINIYWKDFVMKLFFYPIHFKVRKMGTLWALSLATVATFLATWLLHSWQWFWIRGKPLLDWKDFSFWMILAALVLLTAIYETTRGRKRALSPSRFTLRTRLILGLQAGGVFFGMCVLWAYWSCQSWGEFRTLMDAASKPSWRDLAIILAVFALVCVCGMLWGGSSRETSEGRSSTATRRPLRFWPSAVAIAVGSMCLLAGPSVATWTIPASKALIARLHNDVLNARDMDQQRRGYYEELDTGGVNGKEQAWFSGMKLFYRARSDFLMGEIVPSVSTILEGSAITSNHLGMRDREYDKIKPANTYRIVLSGSSHEMGAGVRDDQTFENLVEDHLNRVLPDGHHSRYEILNLSMGGHSVLQRLLRLEELGFEFNPDTAIFCISAVESQLLLQHLTKCIDRGIVPPSDYRELVEQVTRRAGVNRRMPDLMIERNLRPYVPEIYEWVFRRFATQCAERGVRALIVYRPAPVDFDGVDPSARAEMVRIARAAGLEVIDLSPAFDSVANRNTLVVAKWDDHTNALGHRLLADDLYDKLVPLLFGSQGKQQTARLQNRNK